MKQTRYATLFVALALAIAPVLADAKRLGSGRSSGLQRDMPARTAPDATPPKPAQAPQTQPGPAQQAAPATANAAPAAAAAPAKRSWLGPIAGIAAGLGLAALMSHLGLSEAFGSVLLMILLAVAAFFVLRLVMRRFAPQPATPQTMSRSPVQVAWPQPAAQTPEPVAAAPAAPTAAFVPAAFDSDGFERIAKTIFVRLQAANDAGDLEDLRRFTTPEIFAELKADLLERAGATQTTDVVAVDSKVLDVADDGARQIVSVRFSGRVREAAGAEPVGFDEVWHLVKPHGDEPAWRIAGIEQLAASA